MSEHDCVIIPNFGAFIADYSPAVVMDDKSTIPGKDILFNRQLTRNDGLLINALIEEQDLEYAAAKLAIEGYVVDVKKQLSSGKKIDFEGIGQLSLDEAGFVLFLANESNTCLLDSYGLQPITLEKIAKDEAPIVSPVRATVPNRTRRIVLRATSVAAVLALILIFSKPLTDQPIADYASLGFDSSTPAVVMNSTPVSTLKDVPHVLASEPLPIEEAVASVSPDSQTSESQLKLKKYHIIIASFPTQALAQKYVVTFMKKYDFDTVETVAGGGRYRISVAHFDQRNEAVAFVKSLRILNPKFNDSWVLPQTFN